MVLVLTQFPQDTQPHTDLTPPGTAASSFRGRGRGAQPRWLDPTDSVLRQRGEERQGEKCWGKSR